MALAACLDFCMFATLAVYSQLSLSTHGMRTEVLAVVLALMLLGGLGAGYLVGGSSLRTVTSVSVETTTMTVTSTTTSTLATTVGPNPETFASPVSGQGLELLITLNATRIQQHGTLNAKITLQNVLSRNVSLTPDYSSNTDIPNWNQYSLLCGFNTPGLLGFALFMGHYTQANLSLAGDPLTLVPPVALPCAAQMLPAEVVLLPHGDNAVYSYNVSGQLLTPGWPMGHSPLEMNATTDECAATSSGGTECGSIYPGLFGYWEPSGAYLNFSSPGFGNAMLASPYFHYFPPGPYTLVSEDLWDQTVYAYFQVS